MCGIAGIIGVDNKIPISNMVAAMHHRGPDDRGTFSDGNLHIGMARLSIQDTSMAGHQPMFSADKRYAIVFNGEVYNYKELKDTFFKDENFVSGSDTEVVLRLYIKMGHNCLQHFRGMFAFLIWDTAEKTLFGARDRMGIKPLLYHFKNNTLILASELKSVLSSLIVPLDIEESAVSDLFLYGSAQFDKTFVKGVFSMPPASYFYFQSGDTQITFNKYWTFPTTTIQNITFDEAKDNFIDLYKESVKLRLISDRKVGVFLSSGLDSVSILANLRSQNISNIRSFTIGFGEDHHKFKSETVEAQKLSNHFGFENDSLLLGFSDVKPYWGEFISGLDQPSIDGLNTFLVSKYSKEFLTVSLSGLGGDELMLGYPRNVNLYNLLAGKSKPLGFLSDFFIQTKAFGGAGNNKIANYLYNIAGGSKNNELNYWNGRLINQPVTVKQILNNNLSKILHPGIVHDFYKFDDGYESNLMNQISYYETRSYMLSQLLRDMDALSMSQSIEVRFPLIDHKIVEFMFSLPAHFKFKAGAWKGKNTTGNMTYAQSGVKHILAQAYINDLPKDYLNTPKQGFQLPVFEWAAKSFGDDVTDILSALSTTGIFSETCINKSKVSFAENKTLNANLYLMVIYSLWYQSMKDLIESYKNKKN